MIITQTKPDRRYSVSRKTHVAENLYIRHWKIIHLAMTGKYNDTEIAAELGITPQTVQNTLRSPIVQAICRRMIDDQNLDVLDSAKRLAEMMPLATQVAEDLMLDPNVGSGVRAKLALGVMDRNGYGPVTRSISATAVYDAAKIMSIRDRARGAGIAVQSEPAEADNEVASQTSMTNDNHISNDEKVKQLTEPAMKQFVSMQTLVEELGRR